MKFWSTVCLSLMLAGSATWVWAEPTLDQVYSAAHSGHLAQAQSMMQEVLAAHPNSAKAHFVDAEVLARSGDLGAARNELALAEKLDPPLSFANPTAVQALRNQLSGRMMAPQESPGAGPAGSTPWGAILLVGGAALLLVVWLVRRQAQQPVVYSGGPSQPGGYYSQGGVPMGPTGPLTPMGGGGGGSGILGTLATGAALGAGMVAGEALAHRLVDGPERGPVESGSAAPAANFNSDMGGQDFGVSDGSWDSGGGDSWSDSGGGSDWT